MTSPSDSLIGRQLDEYRIDKPLGQGGMARVYRALDTKLRRYVALKVIAPDFRADAEYTARFEREAQSIARLEHPNIVQIYRFGEVGGLYYMAMQYVEGADVGWLIEDYRNDGELMAVQDVLGIVKDIGAALDYAHSKDVIHRDVKPGNIIINKQGRAILTDFGLALLGDVGTHGEIFGSPYYIAPEQAISSGDVVPQSDLYSLGVTLFEMLTGELPFTGGEPMDIAMRHVSEPPPAPSQFNRAIPPAVDEVVLRSLEKEAYARFQTGAEFSAAFEQAVASWRQDGLSAAPGVRRPSLVVAPHKVGELIKSMPLPPLPPLPATPPGGLSPEPPPLSPVLAPSLASTQTGGTRQGSVRQADVASATNPAIAAQTQQVQARPNTWLYAGLFGGALFICGLFALIAVLLATRGSAVSMAQTDMPAVPTVVSPTALTPTETLAPTSSPFPTLAPTFTAVILPTRAAVQEPTIVVVLPTLTAVVPPTSPPVILPTGTPVVIQPPTSTPIVIVSAPLTPTPIPLITPSFNTFRMEAHKDWVAFTNRSSAALSLAQFRLQRDERTLTAQRWGKTALLPGECLRIYKKDKAPKESPEGCTRIFDHPGDKDERDPWFEGRVTVTINPTTTFCYPADKCKD